MKVDELKNNVNDGGKVNTLVLQALFSFIHISLVIYVTNSECILILFCIDMRAIGSGFMADLG